MCIGRGGESCYLYGWSWATTLCTSRWGLFGSLSPNTEAVEKKLPFGKTMSLYGYQWGAMLCVLILLDNLLKRIEGTGNAVWFWFSSGRMELILVFGVPSVVCQVLF